MSDKSSNVVDYLRWRGDLTFEQDPFNEVDNLLLCVVSYINFSRILELRSKLPSEAMLLKDVCEQLTEEDEQRGLSSHAYIPVMRLMASVRRFAQVRMFGYESVHDEEREMQFDAVSFLLPDHTVFAAFMGTDRSLVGWKEDFNMSFLDAVPAQERAAAYAAEIASACSGYGLRLGGHSKGGNLAAWAASHLPEELQRRIVATYNNDGPGFSHDLLETDGYRRVADRMITLIPESSIIGVLLEHAENYEIIDSSNRSVMQHEPLSWNVLGNHFVHQERRSPLGKLSDGVLREWLHSMTPTERETFIEALFDVLSKGGQISSLEELPGGLAGGASFLRELVGAEDEKKSAITDGLRRLMSDVREGLKRGAEDGLSAAKNGLRSLLSDWVRE